jgi:integrase
VALGVTTGRAQRPPETAPSAITVVDAASGLPPALAQRLEGARRFLREGSHAPGTRRKYAEDFAQFSGWCQRNGVAPLPAEPGLLALYIHALVDPDPANPPRVRRAVGGPRGPEPGQGPMHPSSITRVVAAIRYAHTQQGADPPTSHPLVQEALRAARRTLGVAPHRRVQAAVAEVIRRMLQGLDDSPRHRRDRALLTLGFAGAFRRAALVSLDLADVLEVPEGIEVTLRRDKTDQTGAGRTLTIARGAAPTTCPVQATLAWIASLATLGFTEGPLFRFIDRHGNVRPAHRRAPSARLSPQSVALIVQRRARAVGLDATQFAGHSLRAGFVTSAVRAGKSIPKVMEQTGHRSANTVMAYVREADRWRDPASGGIGL